MEPRPPSNVRRGIRSSVAALLLVAFSVAIAQDVRADGPGVDWIVEFGSGSFDAAYGVDADVSGVYVVGQVGSFWFVRKYSPSGIELWRDQSMYAGEGMVFDVAVHATGVYVLGVTGGPEGDLQVLLLKYDSDGNELWSLEFGTAGADYVGGIDVDDTGVYVAGHTAGAFPGYSNAGNHDAFLRKYDADGNEVWTRQFGTADPERDVSVAAGAGGVYVTWWSGATYGTMSVFLRKFNGNGDEVWTRIFGTGKEMMPEGIATSDSAVFVAGIAWHALPEYEYSGRDGFVRQYDANGQEGWTDVFGTACMSDEVHGIAADEDAVYIVGAACGPLPGEEGVGSLDSFVLSYSHDGDKEWTVQFGAREIDGGLAVATADSTVYVAGTTQSPMPGQDYLGGTRDAYVARLGAGDPNAVDSCSACGVVNPLLRPPPGPPAPIRTEPEAIPQPPVRAQSPMPGEAQPVLSPHLGSEVYVPI